jgi:hypothetical protein
MTDPIDFEAAKAMKRMGLPLNTPVERRTLQRETSKQYLRLWDDLTAFCLKMVEYNADPSEKSFKAWTRAFDTLDRHARATTKYIAKLKGGDHEVEGFLLGMFIERKVVPFMEGWDEIFAALEDGEQVTIAPISQWDWSPIERDGPTSTPLPDGAA